MTAPEGLQARGTALWAALKQPPTTPAGQLALEACRTADRLDELDRVVAGKGVLNLMSFRLDLDLEDEIGDRNVNVRVEFSAVLAEARQQQMAFKQMLSALGVEKAGEATPETEGTPLDELAARRRAEGRPDASRLPDAMGTAH